MRREGSDEPSQMDILARAFTAGRLRRAVDEGSGQTLHFYTYLGSPICMIKEQHHEYAIVPKSNKRL